MESQFKCAMCGDGFEQKSRYDLHMATAHPEKAPSAADIEKSIAGIRFPKTKEELVQNIGPSDNLRDLISSLPNRTYRDAAEVAVALGEIKKKQEIRSAQEVAASEPLGRKGGRTVARDAVSAAAVAKSLSGVHFPKRKSDLQDYARDHANDSEIRNPDEIVQVLGKISDREFRDMADVEKAVGDAMSTTQP